MTETLAYINQSLETLYPAGEIQGFTRLIMAHVCGLQPYQLLMSKDKELSDTQKREICRIVERLRQWEPVQYILGEASFYGLSFRVSPEVLIPRPETEELVARIIHEHARRKVSILDVGTGSGCIALSLARHLPDSEVTGLDISAGALRIAEENARRNRLSATFVRTDILLAHQAAEAVAGEWDIIVSNPPYVKESEKAEMERNVLRYEPPQALFVSDEDPLVFYRAIARLAKKKLKKDGTLYFEINAMLGKETLGALKEEGYRTSELIRDLSGKDRFIKAKE
ncbi:MAG: peptide chain release factor N(5)-glutamine methyltransferase [Tannerellaceae bacterium]|jgi:release factor glutamine methyltransferase|nr:peptide chain release factor N(5)-glutamine methyltransferase [Tannerellaceae bacterium]